MGGCEINLGDAKITSEAVIDVLAFWGGIEIRVPRGWRIENHVLAILGGVVDKTDGNGPCRRAAAHHPRQRDHGRRRSQTSERK